MKKLIVFISFLLLSVHSFALSPLKRIAEWNSPTTVSLDEFFLKINDFPAMYRDALNRYESYKSGKMPGKEIKPPAEQLSPKGLALMSYIYTQVDGASAQPLISDSVESLHHISTLMDNAKPGTVVTIIFQPVEKTGVKEKQKNIWNMFAGVHKTTVRLEKQTDGLLAIGMDGSENDLYPQLVASEIAHALEKNGIEKKREATHVYFYMGETDISGRQKSFYECGIFATKDARELNRDLAFSIDFDSAKEYLSKDNLTIYSYSLPTICLKSAQSKTALQDTLNELGETVVTRTGKTLAEKFAQFGGSYSHHYAEKYNEKVAEFVTNNSPADVKNAVSSYDAHAMTQDKLAKVYGPPASEEPQTHADRVKDLIKQHESFIKQSVGKTPEQQDVIKSRIRVNELRKKFEK